MHDVGKFERTRKYLKGIDPWWEPITREPSGTMGVFRPRRGSLEAARAGTPRFLAALSGQLNNWY